MTKNLTVAVGAEGCAELQDRFGAYPNWVRSATKEEVIKWRSLQIAKGRALPVRLIDDTGRPYFLITVLENAPGEAKYKAEHYYRVKRLLE